jgi:TPR repeat protein
MFAKSVLLAATLVLITGACMSAEKEEEQPVSICEDFEFSCTEVAGLSDAALAGSAEAALKLFWFYLDRENKDEALYWAQVAMENGSAVGRHNYASLLADRGDSRSLARAKFHLRALVEQGDKDAESLLREIEKKQNR